MDTSSIISEGDYIVVKRNQFVKLHQYSSKNCLMLGKDKIDLSSIAGKPEWTLYRMVPKPKCKREFLLEVCSKADSVENCLMKDVTSGVDNRDIINDNKSQLLSSEEINGMRESGISSCGIVSALIENSTTFKNKTEYSQVKYLKKKIKKYHEFITIRKPTLRMIAEILFNKDQFKILGLRYDSLSQIITASNIQPNGVYLLYENGTQGLVGAALLNHLSGPSSAIINLSSINNPQKQAILAMNYSKDLLDKIITVKITSLFEKLFPKEDKSENSAGQSNVLGNTGNEESIDSKGASETCEKGGQKRKSDFSESGGSCPVKRPKWADDLDRGVRILTERKADALIIASKEYPLELLNSCLDFVNKSRPLVVYSVFREPLVDLYVELKKKRNVLGLHLTENWLREYQVLEGRTHPLVNMSPSGGYILTATIV